MPTGNDLVAYEDGLVGITENPPGSNRTIIGEQFGWNGVAWCAETQSVSTAAVFGHRIFWSAAVSEWIAAAQRGDGGMSWVPVDGWIEAGMLVTYDFGNPRGNSSHFHIAMVRDPGTQGRFQTDGGNEGDAMRQQWRDRTYVQGFIRLPFDSPEDEFTMDADAKARFDQSDLRITQVEKTAEHIEAMLASAITVINAIKAKVGA